MIDRILNVLPSGWKSTTGGFALLVMGVCSIVLRLVMPDSEFGMDAETAMTMIAAGLGLLGLAHKAERTRVDAETGRQNIEYVKALVEKREGKV